MAGFFPVFFKEFWSAGADANLSTARLGFGVAAASLIIAIFAPLLGAIADQGRIKKPFMFVFAYFGILMTSGLFFVPKGEWFWAIVVYVLCIVGWYGANIFYDAFLTDVASEEKLHQVSSLGFSIGYLGGGILFAFNIFMTLNPALFGFEGAADAVRFSFLTVSVWWGGFSLFTLFWVRENEEKREKIVYLTLIKKGFCQLIGTYKKIRHLKTVFLFLLAYWLYIDGVDTIVVMAVDYGMSIGFESTDLILALLITQFVGFPCALLMGKLGTIWGVKRTLYLSIGVYIFVCLWGMQMQSKWEFFLLAALIGLVQGGIQALSRSYYARIIPENQAAEFFGFYNMLGKFAAILGPALMAIVGLTVKRILSPSPEEMLYAGQLASRFSIASLIILFLAGGLVLFFVDEEKGREEKKILAQNNL